MVEIKVRDGFQEVYDKLIEKKNAVREEIEKEFADRTERIDRMIDECSERIEVPDVVEPVEENNEHEEMGEY